MFNVWFTPAAQDPIPRHISEIAWVGCSHRKYFGLGEQRRSLSLRKPVDEGRLVEEDDRRMITADSIGVFSGQSDDVRSIGPFDP